MWFPPERYSDWYAHLTNQGSHGGLVGVGLGLLAWPVFSPVWAWLAVVTVYFAYEVLVSTGPTGEWAGEWDWRDSLDDTANVGGGAGVLVCALAWGWGAAVAAFGVWGASLALAVWRRL